ncbi:MAG: response regulator, partial [Candidatus Competibacter sp.]
MIKLLKGTDSSEGKPDEPFSVLVVDDELGLLASLKQLLETYGYVAAVAAGGAAALTQLTENRYDLLVLDLGMPGIGGAAVLDFTIERCLDMAVIVISGTTSVVEATAAMRRGAIDYLRKPFGPDELLASIANATRKLRLERANRLMRDRVEASERLHRFLVNHSPDLIFMLDVEGRFSYLNKRVKALLGFETDALVKQPLACLVAPPDRDKAATLLRRLAAGVKEPQLAEWHFLRQEAFRRDCPTPELFMVAEVTVFPIISGNGLEACFTGSYLVARDVTGRRRAEEALRQASARLEHVVSASPAVIYSRDPHLSRPLNFISSNI